jgi:hypothetical protein
MWREIISILTICSCGSAVGAAPGRLQHHSTNSPTTSVEDAENLESVVPISELSLGIGIEVKFGTGFCLDRACRFIGTNYHVAMIVRAHKIKGERVIQRYLASGPDDEGATLNDAPAFGPMKYTLSRDLAIFELQHGLPHHHGVAFSLADLQVGQQVDIYAYPKEPLSPRRKLLRFPGTFKGQTTTGLLAFDYGMSAGKAIRPGASGGIVVDDKTRQIVGVLNGVDKENEAIALAVPIQSLEDFVSKVQPFLTQSIFPSSGEISPVSEDLYPKFIPPTAGLVEHRPDEPYEVSMLRKNAQTLADSMRNFIAVQRLAWGSGDKEPAAQAAYEVRVIDGSQMFRSFPDGTKELEEIPPPSLNHSIVPGVEWSELPEMVGTELRLKVHQVADANVNDKRMMVFQYAASVEDAVCKFTYAMDYLLFKTSRTVTVACYGEVWTDEHMNIIRMSEHYESPGERKIYHVVVIYGWLRRADEPARLIPLTISAKTQHQKQIDWCRGQFTDYQVFGSQVKIIANN